MDDSAYVGDEVKELANQKLNDFPTPSADWLKVLQAGYGSRRVCRER